VGQKSAEEGKATSIKEDDWRLALWLAKVRQSITKNVLSNPVTKPHEWLTKQDCPVCWKDRTQYNTEFLYKYLKTEYGQVDEVTHQYRQELRRAKSAILKHDNIQLQQVSFIAVIFIGAIALFRSLIRRNAAGKRQQQEMSSLGLEVFEDPHVKWD